MATYGYKAPKSPYAALGLNSGYAQATPQFKPSTGSISDPLQALNTASSLSAQTPKFAAKVPRPPANQQPAGGLNYQSVQTQKQTAAPAPPATPTVSYDPGADPTLNKLQALSTLGREGAQAEATKLRGQLAVQYGNEGIGRQYGGETIAAAARDNPNSIAAQILHSHELGKQSLLEDLNKANLWFSGTAVKQQDELARQLGEQQYQAQGQLQSSLAGIDTNLAGALAGYDQQDAQAASDAAFKAMLAQIAAGGSQQPVPPLDGGGPPPPNDPLVEAAVHPPLWENPLGTNWSDQIQQQYVSDPVQNYATEIGVSPYTIVGGPTFSGTAAAAPKPIAPKVIPLKVRQALVRGFTG